MAKLNHLNPPSNGVRVGESPAFHPEQRGAAFVTTLPKGRYARRPHHNPSCMWQSEPVLSDFQALPTDSKAVITFPEETGERDQVWTDIAKAIENRAKALQSGVE